jgi:hypothetical protein
MFACVLDKFALGILPLTYWRFIFILSAGLAAAQISPFWNRTLGMNIWTVGTDQTFIRILEPKKERGMGTLRIGNEMWNYFPRIDKVMKMSRYNIVLGITSGDLDTVEQLRKAAPERIWAGPSNGIPGIGSGTFNYDGLILVIGQVKWILTDLAARFMEGCFCQMSRTHLRARNSERQSSRSAARATSQSTVLLLKWEYASSPRNRWGFAKSLPQSLHKNPEAWSNLLGSSHSETKRLARRRLRR